MRVAVRRPRRGRARSADVVARARHGPARRRTRPDRASTAAPTCAGGWAAARAGCCVLGHHDTVWPLGTLATHPVRRSTDGVLRGPGCFDMKAGLVMAFHADRRPVRRATASRCWSPATRSSARRRRATLIEDEARGCVAALVLEAVGGRRCAEDRSARASRCTEVTRRTAAPRTPGSNRRRASTRASSWRTRCSPWPRSPTRTRAPPSPRPCSAPGPRRTPCRPPASFAVDVRVRDTGRAGAGRRGHARADADAARRSADRRPAARTGRRWRRPRRRTCSRARNDLAAELGLPAVDRARRSAARRTATSRRASACRRWTGSARSAAARTPTTSTCSSRSCPAGPRWSPRCWPT